MPRLYAGSKLFLVVIPIVLVVPAVLVCVIPGVMSTPALFALIIQVSPTIFSFVAAGAVLADGIVKPYLGFLDVVLTLGAIVRLRHGCGDGAHHRCG
jgi:hypothetical protein